MDFKTDLSSSPEKDWSNCTSFFIASGFSRTSLFFKKGEKRKQIMKIELNQLLFNSTISFIQLLPDFIYCVLNQHQIFNSKMHYCNIWKKYPQNYVGQAGYLQDL